MAVLRCIGVFAENSGLDMAWIQSGLYGSATTSAILLGKHVRRGIEAHLISLQALFSQYMEEFYAQNPTLKDDIHRSLTNLQDAFCSSTGKKESIMKTIQQFQQILDSKNTYAKMEAFDEKLKSVPSAKAMLLYMEMVMDLCLFIKSVRTGNWQLHLSSLDALVKYFLHMTNITMLA